MIFPAQSHRSDPTTIAHSFRNSRDNSARERVATARRGPALPAAEATTTSCRTGRVR